MNDLSTHLAAILYQSHRLSRRRFLSAGALVSGGALLAACGSGSSSGTTPTAASSGQGAASTKASGASGASNTGGSTPAASAAGSPAAASTAAATGTPKQGGTLNVGLPVDPGTMDPRLMNDTSAQNINDLCYNGLTYIDPSLNPVPDLATKWESNDPTTWTFTLRDGVTFHDGSPMTADDVKYTFETLTNPQFKSPRLSLYAPIKSVDVVDPHTAKFNLNSPYAPLLAYLDMAIVSKSYTEKTSTPLNDQPMGTGPFKFGSWQKNNQITLPAFDKYYKGKPYLDTVVLHTIPDNGVRAVGIESGSLQLVQSPLNGQDVKRLKGNSSIKTTMAVSPGITYLNINCADPFFSDKRVRQAIAWSVDRKTITDTIYDGMDSPGISSLIPDSWDWDPSVQGYGFDPAKAKSLLQEAGWTAGSDGILTKDGKKFQIDLTTYNDPNRMQMAQFLQNAWKQIGIDAKPGISEWAPFIANVQAGKFQVSIIGWLTLVDPDRAFYREFSTKGDSNWGKYQNAQVDQLLEDARTKSDRDVRKKDYVEAAKLILDDSPYVYVTYQGYVCMTRNEVQGYVVNRDQSLKGIEKTWLSK